MLIKEVDKNFVKALDYSIFSSLIVYAIGLLTSPSLLALAHILMALPCLYFATITDWKKMPKSAWALLGLSVAIMLSVAVNHEIMIKGWKPFFKVKYFLFGFFSIVPFYWWINHRGTQKRYEIILLTSLFATTIATWSGLCGTFFGVNLLLFQEVKLGIRNGGIFGMLMNYAHNMSYFIVLLFGIILNHKKLNLKIDRKILIIFFVINLIGLYYSFTRGAWLAIIAGIPMYFYFNHKKIFICLFMGLLFVGAIGFFVAGDKVIRPESESQRISQWQAAYYAFKEKPILGYGYLNFEEYSIELKKKYALTNQDFGGHAHNSFMEILASTGIVGFLFMMAWLVLWIKEAKNQYILPFVATFVIGGLTQATIALGINLFFIMIVYSLTTREKSNLILR